MNETNLSFKLDNINKENIMIIGQPNRHFLNEQKKEQGIGYIMEFHPSAICMYDCPHCQGKNTSKYFDKKECMLPISTIDSFFNSYDNRTENNDYLKMVIISGICGEPLLNYESCERIIQSCKDRSVNVGISTAGIDIDENLSKLLNSKNNIYDWVNISIDAPLGIGENYDLLYAKAHGKSHSYLENVMDNIKLLSKHKSVEEPCLSLNLDWIISDINIDKKQIYSDLVSTIDFLVNETQANQFRMQFPFYFYNNIPRLSQDNEKALYSALNKINEQYDNQTRDDFNFVLRRNSIKRLPYVSECDASRKYGVVIGPDSRIYHCPYLASPEFKEFNQHLDEIKVDNLWSEIKKIPALNTKEIDKCQHVCNYRTNFMKANIVK